MQKNILLEDLKKRCEKYNKLTKTALRKAKLVIPKDSAMYDIAKDFLEMARNYLNDGEYFEKQENYILALASYSYAHAWIDASARIGFVDVKQDHNLFTLFK